MGYKECLQLKREQLDYNYRLPLWQEYNRQMQHLAECRMQPKQQTQVKFNLPDCPPEPNKPPVQAPR